MYSELEIVNEKQKNKRNRKKYIIIMVILLAILATALLIKYLTTDNTRYVLINNSVIFMYKDDKLIRMSEYEQASSNQRYKVYHEGNHIGNYYINNDMVESEYFFYHKTKKESYSFKMPYIAISKNIDYVSFSNTILNESDYEEIEKMMGIGYIKKEYFSLENKVYKDIDNDGVDETIYSIAYLDEDNINNSYSAVYMKKDGVIYTIIETKGTSNNSENEFPEFGQYNLVFMLDIKKDRNFQLVIEYSDEDASEYNIYEFIGGSYQIMEQERK